MSELDDLKEMIYYDSMPTTEGTIENLIDAYHGCSDLINAIKELQDEVKGRLSEIMAETGQATLTAKTGKAKITSPGVSMRITAAK